MATLLLGCSGLSPTPSPSPVATDRLAETRRTLDDLAAAVLARDRPGFDHLVSLRDTTFESRARLLYANLTTLPLNALRFRVDPAERRLGPERQRVLGPDAWVHPVVVVTRQVGEAGAAEHALWLTFVADDGRAKLAGTFDGPVETGPLPLWWLGPVTAAVDGGASVVAGAGQPAAMWADLANRSARTVRAALPPGLAEDWSGRVSLEIPATERDFASVLGEPVGRRTTGIAAVTRPAGSAADSPLRIVANPRAREIAGAKAIAELLRHEIVHLATRSPVSAGPLWAEEGLAEWVALSRTPVDGHPAARTLLTEVERRGPPDALPADDAFTAGAPELNRAYAEAWLVCRYVAERYSAARLGRLYTELGRRRSLDQASRAALGIGGAELVSGWRRYLVRLARTA